MILYLSHGADAASEPDGWFIVEPRDDPDAQIESLLDAGRIVVEVHTRPPEAIILRP